MKPRVLFVARGPYELPLHPDLERRWQAIGAQLEYRVLATGVGEAPGFRLAGRLPALEGPAFYAALPARIASELRAFAPHVVLAQGAHETAAALAGRRLSRRSAAVIADLHGDWRAPTRLYGSRLRGLLSPVADRLATAAIRRADGVRTVTAYTSELVRGLGVEPTDEFPAYMDFQTFLRSPPVALPERPQALFVGVLERYKNVDGLAEAWRQVAWEVPRARLRVVGSGTLEGVVRKLVAELPDEASWTPRLTQAEISAALDESTLLVLPSRSEGMGRVMIEAFCRGRPVVASRVGGIPDVVKHESNGLLVEPGDGAGLSNALVHLLSDRALAERLGEAARGSADTWTISPEEFALRLRALVERVAGLS